MSCSCAVASSSCCSSGTRLARCCSSSSCGRSALRQSALVARTWPSRPRLASLRSPIECRLACVPLPRQSPRGKRRAAARAGGGVRTSRACVARGRRHGDPAAHLAAAQQASRAVHRAVSCCFCVPCFRQAWQTATPPVAASQAPSLACQKWRFWVVSKSSTSGVLRRHDRPRQ